MRINTLRIMLPAALSFAVAGTAAWAAPAAKSATAITPGPSSALGPIEPLVPVPREIAIRPPASMRRFAASTRSPEEGGEVARPMIFEGRLLDTQKRRVTGTYLLDFHFWDSAQGGSEVWSESRYVSVTNGIYAIKLRSGKEMLQNGFAPGNRVTVTPPAGTGWLVSQPPYYVQAGSFTEPMRAMSLHYDLKQEFGQAVITESDVDGAKRYQVRVGPFEQRLDAEDIAWWLESTGHEAMIVMAER